MRYILAIDAGYGSCKAMLFDLDSKNYYVGVEKWEYIAGEDFLLKEFNPDLFFEKICENIRKLLKKINAEAKDIVAISSSSMRHSYVFLDEKGKEVYAGPNVDARGIYYQDLLEEKFGDNLRNITGQWPPLIFAPARLLWFREEQPEKFGKIKYVLTTNDWIIYKLCNVLATEPSIASATMFLDIRKKKWYDELLEELKFNIELPEIYETGSIVGELEEEAAKKMGLAKGIPIVMGGADSQIAMLSCHAVNDGDVAVITGTSAPIMMSVSKPIIDEKKRIWTNCHVVSSKWVLEANAQIAGANYEWLKNVIKEFLGISDNKIYELMDKKASEVESALNDIFAFLGPEIMNVGDISVVRPGIFYFQQPSHPMTSFSLSLKHFIRASLENIAFAIRANVELLEEIAGKKVDSMTVTGGLTKSKIWPKILSNSSGRKIVTTKIEDGTALGCVIAAAFGIGLYNNIEEAFKDISKLEEEVSPEKIEDYKRGYERWLELYQKIAELSVSIWRKN